MYKRSVSCSDSTNYRAAVSTSVQDTEDEVNRCNEWVLTDVDHDFRIAKEVINYIIDAVDA